MKKLILYVVFSMLLISVYAQERTVSGKVVSLDDDSPMPGVNILIKGTRSGTVTDLDGAYSLVVPGDSATLVYSLVGYISEEIAVGNKSEINVELAYGLQELMELVIVGYGSQQRKDISSAIASIDTDQMQDVPVYSFDAAMQGLSSGLNISSPSGTPGAAINVNIRGATSISASSQPLYIIDGIPVVTGNNSALNSNIQPTNPLADMNPADIESISVLKDASAVAIYGSRGANGVILINTKRGSDGKTKVNVNYYSGISEINNTPELMNSRQWVEFLNVAAANDGLGENYWSDIIGDPESLPTYNAYDEVFRMGTTHNADVSVSGGSEKTNFYLSGNYFNQEGIQVGQDFNRFSGRFNIDHRLNSKLTVGATMYLGIGKHNRTINENDEYGVVINAQAWDPTTPLYDETGTYINPFSGWGWWALENPLLIAKEYINKSNSNRIQAQAYAEWEIIEGLSFKSSFSIDKNTLTEESFTPAGFNESDEGQGIFATYDESNVIHENTLNWKHMAGKHDLNALAGFTWQQNDKIFSDIRGQGYASNDKYKIRNAATITSAESNGSSYGLISYLLRFNYGYDNRYLVSLTGRADGSSRFGEEKRFGIFPSASVAWNAHNESFLKDIAWLSQLKIRGSYGIVGNQEIGDETWTGKWNLSASYDDQGGIQPESLANPVLTWEQTTQTDIGLDLGILQNKIGLTADYFIKNTESLLLSTNISGNSGFKTLTSNAGTIENKGFEIALNTINVNTDKFDWTSSINYTHIQNKVVDVVNDGEILSRNFILKEGEPLSSLYLIKFLGVDPATGDAQFQDYNSNGLINFDDRQIAGGGMPTYFGGFNNVFSYDGFSLQVLFYFSGGNKIFNQSRYAYENYGTLKSGIPYGNYNTRSLNYWKQPGDITDIPRPSHVDPDNSQNGQWQRFSTQYMEDGDFVRLKTVKLSYNFKSEVLEKLKLNSLTVYGVGQNLLTWTNYLGFDPEINTNTSSESDLNVLQGEDFGTLGQARTFTLGINIGF
ncbi:MAG: TonB-dependent receptor [Cyclobacteriaceae bacterium]|nr:TonB-dependent receptor [Cyclobacteriaceae bacterium]